jgi:hypothetical protein
LNQAVDVSFESAVLVDVDSGVLDCAGVPIGSDVLGGVGVAIGSDVTDGVIVISFVGV